MNQKVVIIGAGVSGLSAAYRLYSAGISDVTILEAGNRIGGRVNTVYRDGRSIELGAQWIHGAAGNAIYELLSRDVDLLPDENDDYEAGEVFFASGKTVSNKLREVFNKSWELITKMEIEVANRVEKLGESNENVKDVSLSQIAANIWNQDTVCGTQEEHADTNTVLKNVLDEMNITDGDSLDKLGCLMYHHYIEYPGGDIKIPGGYSILLEKLCKNIPVSAIKLNSKVKSVVWNTTKKLPIFDQNRRMNGYSESNDVSFGFALAENEWNDENVVSIPSGMNTDSHFGASLTQSEDQISQDFDNLCGNGSRASGSLFHSTRPVTENGVSLQPNSRPVKVHYLDAGSNLTTISADHVIVTVSLGYLKKHHKTLLLPNFTLEKQDFLEILGFGTVNKIILYYRKPFWGGNGFCLYPLWDHYEGTDDFADDNHWCRHLHRIHTVQGNCIMAWANVAASEKIRHLPRVEIGKTIVALIQRCRNDVVIPQPDEVIMTDWGKDENFLGSYSCTRIGETMEMKRKVFEPLNVAGVPRILFAGEATHESRFSTVDGAYQTGVREADRLLKFFK